VNGTQKAVLCYGIVIAILAIAGLALADAGSKCHSLQWKWVFPDGTTLWYTTCVRNGCPVECDPNGGGYPAWAVCSCPGGLMFCNASRRRNPGTGQMETQCLGGCPSGSGTYCEDPPNDPWVLVTTYPNGTKVYGFECNCE